jgi:hypothetical protein
MTRDHEQSGPTARPQPESHADIAAFAKLQADAIEAANPHDDAPCLCDPCTLDRMERA